MAMLFPNLKRLPPFLTVDATTDNQAFIHDKCTFPGLRWPEPKLNRVFQQERFNRFLRLLAFQ